MDDTHTFTIHYDHKISQYRIYCLEASLETEFTDILQENLVKTAYMLNYGAKVKADYIKKMEDFVKEARQRS